MSGSAVKHHTVDQREEGNYMQNGQLRTSCCSRVIHQFWQQLSSSTSTLQGLSSTSPAQERSDGLAPGGWSGSPSKPKKIKKRDGNRDSDDRLRDLPVWWEEFTDNLEDTGVHAQAHFSRDSDSERTTKVVTKSRTHSRKSHFPKDRNCEVCLRTKMTRAPCRRRTGETLLRW